MSYRPVIRLCEWLTPWLLGAACLWMAFLWALRFFVPKLAVWLMVQA